MSHQYCTCTVEYRNMHPYIFPSERTPPTRRGVNLNPTINRKKPGNDSLVPSPDFNPLSKTTYLIIKPLQRNKETHNWTTTTVTDSTLKAPNPAQHRTMPNSGKPPAPPRSPLSSSSIGPNLSISLPRIQDPFQDPSLITNQARAHQNPHYHPAHHPSSIPSTNQPTRHASIPNISPLILRRPVYIQYRCITAPSHSLPLLLPPTSHHHRPIPKFPAAKPNQANNRIQKPTKIHQPSYPTPFCTLP